MDDSFQEHSEKIGFSRIESLSWKSKITLKYFNGDQGYCGGFRIQHKHTKNFFLI